MTSSRLLGVFLLVIATSMTLAAQARSKVAENSLASKLVAIKVTGTQRYTDKEVVAASGLQIGQNAGDADFKAATRRLADTGLFTDLAYSFASSVEGTKLEIQLTDNNQLVPVRFDNIPWFSDQQLIEKVQAQVPLFKGQLPVEGDMVDQVADVMEALLVQVNPRVHSTYLESSPNPGGQIDSVVFSVSGTDIRIRNVEYPGASTALLSSLTQVSGKLQGDEYHRNTLEKFAAFDLKPVYSKRGYLKVAFGDAEAQVAASTAEETKVDVKIPVVEGEQYKLSGMSWSGNTVFPAAKLQSQIRQQPDQVVDAVQLDEDLDRIRASFGTRGYVKAVLRPKPEFDDAHASVVYTIDVQEGDQYRMGELEIDGVNDTTHARLMEDWRLRQGETYDSSYAHRFVKECQPDLPKAARWDVNIYESVNDSDKTVDVTLRFTARSPG